MLRVYATMGAVFASYPAVGFAAFKLTNGNWLAVVISVVVALGIGGWILDSVNAEERLQNYVPSSVQHVLENRVPELSAITGIPAEAIYQEIVSRKVSPGDWAKEHGLGRFTFEVEDPHLFAISTPRGRGMVA